MSNDFAFADSARPARVVCLRLLLQDYSIGHELLLWRERNPILLLGRETFAELPEEHQTLALIRAVCICSKSWSENQKQDRWLRLWGWLIRKTDWDKAYATFQDYINVGRKLMRVLNSSNAEDAEAYEIAAGGEKLEKGGRSLGSPFLSQLILFVTNDLHTPIRDAYDVNYALAGNLYFAKLENEGRLHIENVKEAETRREMAEHRAAVEKEEQEASKTPEPPTTTATSVI